MTGIALVTAIIMTSAVVGSNSGSEDVYSVVLAITILIITALTLFAFFAFRQTAYLIQIVSSTLETMEDGFAVFDASGCLLLYNNAFARLYSLPELQAQTTPFLSPLIANVPNNYKVSHTIENGMNRLEAAIPPQSSREAEVTRELSDGRSIRISERQTSTGLTVSVHSDLTEYKSGLKAAQDELKVRDEFMSVLSHELRTPLTIILGYAKILTNLEMLDAVKLLRAEKMSASGKAMLDRLLKRLDEQGSKIQRSGKHVLTLVNDILDYSKIESGKFELIYSEVELKKLISEVVEEMGEFAAVKGLRLLDRSSNLSMRVDEVRFKQVLINLIGNAIKFSDDGCVQISTKFRAGSVLISVSDDGCGIDPDRIERIFAAFSQEGTSKTGGGTGLGLAISRQIVRMHGGELRASSKPGIGSVFTFDIPIRQPAEMPSLGVDSNRLYSRSLS